MKKALTLIAGIAFVAVLFTSCKKDYTCTCTVTGTGVSASTIIKDSKKNATTTCESGTIAGSVTCAIK